MCNPCIYLLTVTHTFLCVQVCVCPQVKSILYWATGYRTGQYHKMETAYGIVATKINATIIITHVCCYSTSLHQNLSIKKGKTS